MRLSPESPSGGKEMHEELEQLAKEVKIKLGRAETKQEVEKLWLAVFGKKGKFAPIAKNIKNVDPKRRADYGKKLNAVKKKLNKLFSSKRESIEKDKLKIGIDVTMPGKRPKSGSLHLVTLAIDEIASIFSELGFVRRRYREIEWEWYAFDSLNMPPDHPARDDFETFFIDTSSHDKLGKMVLSPHTTSGQVREMRKTKPPIRMINIAKCYRPNWDISHTPMFHQFDGLVIDKDINIIHLKGTLDYFVKNFFGKDRKARIRPFHFQFTEPSFEVDVSCGLCLGKGCKMCKEGWHELGGAGMVHPNVFKAGGIDHKKYSGFAFGWGIERVFLMKKGLKIPDLRILYQNDIRFLKQF